jgi:hypothetical protein
MTTTKLWELPWPRSLWLFCQMPAVTTRLSKRKYSVLFKLYILKTGTKITSFLRIVQISKSTSHKPSQRKQQVVCDIGDAGPAGGQVSTLVALGGYEGSKSSQRPTKRFWQFFFVTIQTI